MVTETEIAPSAQTIEAQRQLLEQQWEAQQKQALRDAAGLSQQEAEVLRAQRDNQKQGNVIGASVAAVGAGAAAKLAIDKAREFRNPETLAQQAGAFVKEQASKGNGFLGWGKFDATRAAEKADKVFKSTPKVAEQVKADLASMANAAKNAEGHLDVGVLAKNAKDAAKELKSGANFNVSAGQDIAAKSSNWLVSGTQSLQRLPKGIQRTGTVAAVAGMAVLGKVAYDKFHEGSKQQAAMLNEQIAAKEAEAAKYTNAIETTKWQDYIKQREAASQGMGQPQLG